MNKLLHILIAVGTITLSSVASANWTASAGYADFQFRGLSMVYGSAGYKYDIADFTFMPELRIGLGASDADNFIGTGIVGLADDLAIDSFISASIRGQYNFNDSFGIFLQPSYSRIEQSAAVNNINLSDTRKEFDTGIGATYSFSENVSVEVRVESAFNYDIASIGLRYSF